MSDHEDDSEEHKAITCANHICAKEMTDIQGKVACPLCRTPVYCTEQCRMIDWPKHECPNVRLVEKLGEQVFVPYFYQEFLADPVLQELEFNDPIRESFLVVHHGTNHVVSQHIQAPMIGEDLVSLTDDHQAPQGRGSKPSAKVEAMREYTLVVDRIEGNNDTVRESVAVKGSIPDDLVFKENKQNSRARKLAGFGGGFGDTLRGLRRRMDKSTGSLLFWPDPKKVELSQEGTVFPLRGTLRVTLFVKGGPKDGVMVRGGYDISGSVASSRLGKSAKKHFEGILKLKFPGANAATKFMHVVHGRVGGKHVAITFLVRAGEQEAQLMDVEFMVPENKLMGGGGGAEGISSPIAHAQEFSFDCDPRKVNQVIGLTIALENELLDTPTPELDHVAGIIRQYARTLLANKGVAPEDVPMDVNTAIHTAVSELASRNILVGPSLLTRFGRARDRFNASSEVRKYVKEHGDDPAALEQEFNVLLDNIRTLRNQDPPQNAEAEVSDARYLATYARQKHRKIFARSAELERVRQSPLTKRKLFRKRK